MSSLILRETARYPPTHTHLLLLLLPPSSLKNSAILAALPPKPMRGSYHVPFSANRPRSGSAETRVLSGSRFPLQAPGGNKKERQCSVQRGGGGGGREKNNRWRGEHRLVLTARLLLGVNAWPSSSPPPPPPPPPWVDAALTECAQRITPPSVLRAPSPASSSAQEESRS